MVKKSINLIKGCYAIYGDTITIKNKFNTTIPIKMNENIFPYDTSLHWTIDNYGPLYMPKKGDSILINSENAKHYKDPICFETKMTASNYDKIINADDFRKYYIFKYNYYFMLGDNFYNSKDSRYWGFLPET